MKNFPVEVFPVKAYILYFFVFAILFLTSQTTSNMLQHILIKFNWLDMILFSLLISQIMNLLDSLEILMASK